MLKQINKYWAKRSSIGQSMVEYLLLVTAVVVVLILAVGPNGMFTRRVDDTVDRAMFGTKCLVQQVCYDPAGCAPVVGDGCCERVNDETDASIDCCTPRTRCSSGECGVVSDGCVGTINCGPC